MTRNYRPASRREEAAKAAFGEFIATSIGREPSEDAGALEADDLAAVEPRVEELKAEATDAAGLDGRRFLELIDREITGAEQGRHWIQARALREYRTAARAAVDPADVFGEHLINKLEGGAA